MADATVTSPAPRKRRGWLRTMGWIAGIFILLLAVLYFVATSSAFVKGVILPKVSASLHANVTVSEASISPFSQVLLRDLKVQSTGTEPLVSAPEVRLRYSLMDIIRGNIVVHEVALVSPAITLVQNPDGSSNLDPILKAQQSTPSEAPKESKPAKAASIDIKRVTLSNGTIRQIKLYAGGKRDMAELSNVNVELADLKNGQTGKLTLGSDIKMENNPPAPAASGLLQAKLNGNFTFALTPDLKPGSIQGATKVDVTRAEGALAQASGLGLNLDCQVNPTEIKQVALVLQKGNARLGQILASGPFDMEKTEGRLAVLLDVNNTLFNLAGASSGMDFGPTTINSTNLISLANAGKSITAAGALNLSRFQVTRTNQTTPPLDLRASYDLTVDNASQNVLLRAFDLAGTQNGNQFLKGGLASPMSISLKEGATNAIGDSALNVVITHFDLAAWKAFLGDMASSGDVNAKLQLLSRQAGKQLEFDLDSEVANLTVGAGSNQITAATVAMRVRGQAANMEQFNLPEYRLQVSRQNQPVATVSGSGVYDKVKETADFRLEGELLLPRLMQLMPQPQASISSGTAKFNARALQKQNVQNVTAGFALAELNGRFGSNVFRNFGATADLDLGMNPQQVQIRKCSGKITEGPNPGGAFELTGMYDLTNKSAKIDASLMNFNQAGLRTFLEPALAEKKLVSVALNANASAQYDPNGASAVKADLQVTNLVVNDPAGNIPATPLEVRMQADASLNKQIAEIRQLALGLTPTDRATNRVQLTGRVDMTLRNNIQGNLKLAADSLDFTTYYDLFAGKTSAAAQTQGGQQTPPSTPAPAKPAPEKEPEPTTLPFTNFVAEALIGKLFLHEMAITNFQTVVKIDGGHVLVDPYKLNLNGAPVNARVNLDLGVPGYKYDVLANATAIPLAPLVNSFQPERRGQVGGTLTADAKITGAGTTGAALQKNLAGHFDVGSTNLNLSVKHIRNPLLKALINVVAMIPELSKNPENALSSLAGSIMAQPGAGRTGGLATELEKSPIDQIVLRGSMGGGKVQLQQALVQGASFQALASGTVQLEAILTNSQIQIPVSLALSRSVASRINMVPADAPTNQPYVKIPDFVTMKGTVGQPKTDINKVALAGTVFQGVKQYIPGGTGETGNLIQGLLGGSKSSSTNAPAGTNRPAGGVGGLLQGILGGSTPTTNSAGATNASAATNQNQNPVGNLLNGLLGPKKK